MPGSLNVSLYCHDTIQQVGDTSRTQSHPLGISKGNFLEMTKHFTGGRFFSPSFHKAQGHILTAQCITTVFPFFSLPFFGPPATQPSLPGTSAKLCIKLFSKPPPPQSPRIRLRSLFHSG